MLAAQETPKTQDQLQQLDSLLDLKKHEEALLRITELETQHKYTTNQKNNLELQLKKATLLYQTGEKEKAINLLLKGIDELKLSSQLLSLKTRYSFFIGGILVDERNFSKSRAYYRLFLKDFKSKKDTLRIIYFYNNIGLSFYNEELNDSAKIYFNKSVNIPISTTNSELISNAYNNLSAIAIREKKYNLAEEYGNKSFKIIEQQQDTLDIAIALINLSNILYPKKEYSKIRANYLKAYESVKNLKSIEALEIKSACLYNLSYVSEELHEYKKAFYYLDEATNLKDSLAQANTAQNISEIEAKYNVAKEAQKTEEEKSKRLKAQVRFYGTAMVFLVMLVLGYIFYRNYRLKQRNKLEQLENEAQTKIINATIDAKEKERKAIAETLHDSVSALLSSVNLHLQATKAKLEKKTPKEVFQAQEIVGEASIKIRDLSHELISSVLLKFGLAYAVHDMCQKYSNSQISFHSNENGIQRYDQDFEIKIHNIIEELINNILKHSKATAATIMLAHRKDDKLSIRITDDGVGFDVSSVRGDGLGLSHINARIKVMKGVFNIVSSKEDGTNVFMLVPIDLKGR